MLHYPCLCSWGTASRTAAQLPDLERSGPDTLFARVFGAPRTKVKHVARGNPLRGFLAMPEIKRLLVLDAVAQFLLNNLRSNTFLH